MRLIDANKLKDNCTINIGNTTIGQRQYVMFHEIDDAPTIDAVEVVRCKDCKYWAGAEDYDCEIHSGAFGAEDFCSYGERRDESEVE